jgi:hypothetical protein
MYQFGTKKKIKICKGKLDGTTFTGCPFTTFGNTLRTICYALFACNLAGLGDNIEAIRYFVRLFVAGDDIVLLVKDEVWL